MILAGDIGGTKCLFGLFEGGQCIAQRRLASADFPTFSAALAAFLAQAPQKPLSAASFAIAGPVADGGRYGRLTNLPWTLDSATLAQTLHVTNVVLVNDFAAAALGSVTCPHEQRVTLQTGEPIADAPSLVLGAGTGLGMALALPIQGGWRIVPGEGGHVGFAPADDQQIALWQYLRGHHKRVIWEHVVSGPGLASIHAFLSGDQASPDSIGRTALEAPQSAEASALNLFLAAYGAFAGDMAMATLARGGIFLAGGIAAKVLPALQGSERPFLHAFLNKGSHASLMPPMPIHVVTDPAVGLRGAAMLLSHVS
ncbi:MAG: glucokinase [Rhodocyclaceae bacterium]|nr:glucokinase [Rhodocyclaceae bacterium]